MTGPVFVHLDWRALRLQYSTSAAAATLPPDAALDAMAVLLAERWDALVDRDEPDGARPGRLRFRHSARSHRAWLGAVVGGEASAAVEGERTVLRVSARLIPFAIALVVLAVVLGIGLTAKAPAFAAALFL